MSQQALATSIEMAARSHQTHLKRLSKATRQAYIYNVNRLTSWLAERGITHLHELDWLILEEFVADLYEPPPGSGHGPWQAAAVKQAVSAIRHFLEWCCTAGWISEVDKVSLFRALKYPKVEKNDQRTLTMDEIERLLAVCDLTTPKGLRDAALISLLTDSGLRASEVCRLLAADLEFEVKILPTLSVNRFLVRIKGNKVKPGYFGHRTALLLEQWLKVREALAGPGVTTLFISTGGLTPGQGLTSDGLRVILRKLGEAAGVKGVSAHAFRRAFACILEMAGASTRTVQELGRWENLDMVLLYTRAYKAALTYNKFAPMDFMQRLLSGEVAVVDLEP
jgi:integrase/recombinase XerD